MYEIEVDTELLMKNTKELAKLSSSIEEIYKNLSTLCNSLDKYKYNGQLARKVFSSTTNINNGALVLSSHLNDLKTELYLRAIGFERANSVVGNLLKVFSNFISDKTNSSVLLNIYSKISNLNINYANLILTLGGFSSFAGISYSVISQQKRSGFGDILEKQKSNDELSGPINGNPKPVGELGLHDDAHNARDYASSTDPGTTESDHQRIVVPGREVYAYGEGNILGVYFNEHNKNYPTSPGNDDGITIEVLYFDGYRVKYTHVVPSERLLEISGVNKSDVRFYHPEVNPTLKGDTSIHEGDLIGSYNQIGFSPDIPHLHIDTWDKQGHPIDPKDTGIPERTLR